MMLLDVWILLLCIVLFFLLAVSISRFKQRRDLLRENEQNQLLKESDPNNWFLMKRVKCPDCKDFAEILGKGHSGDKVRCRSQCGKNGSFDGLYIIWVEL